MIPKITCGSPQAKLAVIQHFSLGYPEFLGFDDLREFLDQSLFATSLSNIEIGEEVFPYRIYPVAIRYQIEQRL